MDTTASQVLYSTLVVIAKMVERVEDVAADLFTTGDDPAAARREYIATVRSLAAHRGQGNRLVVTFPADTPGGRTHGHLLASAVLDRATEAHDLPAALITDHPGMSVLTW